MSKIYINGRLYAKAREEGWLTSLSYFVYWSSKYPSKFFHVKDLKKFSRSCIKYNLKVLESKGLAVIENGYVKFTSNSKIRSQLPIYNKKREKYEYSSRDKLYIKNPGGINNIKLFLKSVPFLSNISWQRKMEGKKERIRTIYSSSSKNQPLNVSKKERKKLNELKDRLGQKRFDELHSSSGIQLSIKGSMKVLGVSRNTAIKYRRKMERMRLVTSERVSEVIGKCSSKEEFRLMRSYYDTLPLYARYYKGNILVDKSTIYQNSFRVSLLNNRCVQ